MLRRESQGLVWAVVWFAVVVGSCADGATQEPAPINEPATGEVASTSGVVASERRSVRRVAEDTSSNQASPITVERIPDEGVVYAAPLVLEGVVEEVAGPFWNQVDGQKWEDRDSYTVPFLYREITLRTTRVLRDDDGVAGGTFTFLASGGGLGSDDLYATVGGTFSEGDHVVVMLSPGVLPMREGPTKAYWTFFGSQGVHVIADEEQLADLVERIGRARDVIQDEWEPYRLRVSVDLMDQQIAMIEYFIEHGEWPPPGDFPPPDSPEG